MSQTLTLTSTRLLGLPAVARLMLFARHEGPAVLLTTTERAPLFEGAGVFGAPVSRDPDLSSWHERRDKVVLTLPAALRPFPADPARYTLALTLGRDYPRETLLERLVAFGFERDAMPGFVVRGDTLTLYLDAEDEAKTLRLEFFGDELERLTLGEEGLGSYTLAPLPHAELGEEAWTSRLLEQLPGVVFLDSSELFAGEAEAAELKWLWAHLGARTVVTFGRDPLELPEGERALEPLGYYRGKLRAFAKDAQLWLEGGYSVTLLLRFERTGRYLLEKVLGDLDAGWEPSVRAHPGRLGLTVGAETRGGFRDPEAREIVLTEDLLYGYQGARAGGGKKLAGRRVQDAVQLSAGDYLIHPDHGIGRFMGLEPRQVLGVTRDYLILQYAGAGKLYLPVEQLPLLRRHPGTTDDPPRLSTLGTNEWARARERARVGAQELALKLIRTYAERQLQQGLAMPANPEWDPLIDENCPFELTPDQKSATQAVLHDMARPVPMDRLISGDVGFGKTEVAIRAAHRAVGHGKQVAMLVPTTVLAKQHFETFAERFAGLPVVVELLSRFSTDKEARDILAGLKAGTIDVVIGTHRLLSEEVAFKDLGLLIVDEEHRFGVGQKERMKAMKANLDVLSLSATPIPRTLYMSLVGLRDVSQIMTPPAGRKPIQTVLQPFDPMVAREAVMFELERGGKVFYIHDRVGSMGAKALWLQKLVPEARIGVAHGQMSGDELEEVMLNFQGGAYDVLLATTIVESGLDVAGANTLLIERADKLGLAQLYQLRGRVGRRSTEAWAYLLYPGRLTEGAQRRLFALAELNDLGSGHLLAEKDMEIRGVGNLLGPEQHGHISAVSLEVYTEMLAEEIAKLKGETQEAPQAVAIDLNLDARLSPSYIADDDARIAFYGRLAETTSLAEVARVQREMRERYGPLPDEVRTFTELVKLRLLAAQKGVVTITEHMTDIQVSFAHENLDYDARKLKTLPFGVEPTRYPPGFSLKKRGLRGSEVLGALTDTLYLYA
ncbi:transcription-repair coupling factor [Truepera radiovictrix]|uniref:Transcription-repair-coupling factor n=1 Tax=Truepera radiovictrix (strain DSM 17093 / CIP 108686 / LMG 22925 / RQ-24) TaxID=649638 RepID=D7CXF7_TRURR|nr:transcription-repair coupling factor [Truepera radiovictrix]ADI13281.1 transcription-repair coupling factor [Truepera radiovictrix DSM 17093]WMT58155.1 transcription-repair coupling factor [Truepera radiovictrix]